MTHSTQQKAQQVRFVEVDADQEGQRIDNFLRTCLKGAPKSLIYRILRKGEIRVNKKRVKPDSRLCAGDIIRIPPIRIPEKGEAAPVGEGLAQHLEQAVLYESDSLIIINKPSGLAVHGGSGVNLGMIEALRQIRPKSRFLELVHRLDRDTSGCIMVAKKRSMLRYLHDALRQRKVNKVYQALVVGRWGKRQQTVDAPLLRYELKSGERMVKPHPDGKASVTRFQVLRRFQDVATLVEARPLTGRTHQIRVHTQFAGHPIVGDVKYTPDEDNARFRSLGFKRLMLHAAKLEVSLPDGEKLSVSAPLDPETTNVLDKLAQRFPRQES
ncbi:23S rRNA pseudouridine(955/2504/2580) synthase RluC [Marinobacterium sp. AK62]|uniref:Pseudouridine synthase n=1 Tax=Marinobacterium alkalitolerans TaxID=1542925 RepID=A0ABS3ZAK2_9GAMM|nr:23S rRNA pseudouridine(955/2504/2580) synthase RluC [Marinobacterium alkalitolerans]MBP0048669.1 23S rRNA pseudouridine(955/2504/2580) synthase RluC [Marinobacterium alkalitolerans]